ncbi:MAG: amidohydrolase [Myxococcota bacterium]
MTLDDAPDLILTGGRIATLDRVQPQASAVAMKNGRFTAVGSEREALARRSARTKVVDLSGRTVIPGLSDSHTHVIRGGLTFNAELRWEGVRSLGEALERLREQARRTPAPQWVRVVGGWSEFQFEERRMPTLEEINAAAPDTPVFILHLYARALLNRAAVRALGYDRNPPPDFDRGLVQTDEKGRATGMLIAKPSALILYKSLAAAPKLSREDQKNSTRQFMLELNRLGVTSAIDAGGGGQNYPEDYSIIKEVRDEGHSTLRLAYNLFAQQPGREYDDYARWVEMTHPGDGDAMLKVLGAGENLVWSAADFENFLEPRPDLSTDMEPSLEKVVRLLARRKWPFRIHATYDESISRFLDVFERVHDDFPIDGLHWMIDHAETISERSIDRIQQLGGGVAIQHRMAFQGEYFIQRYGREAVKKTPPVRKMLEVGVPVGAGTDATRVASYNPWVGLYWLSTGRTIGGTAMYDDDNILEREEALRLWTQGSAWFSSDERERGTIKVGQQADLAVLSADYFTVPDERIKSLESVLTVVDGRVVHAAEELASHGPPPLPASPDWSPKAAAPASVESHHHHHHCTAHGALPHMHEPGVLHEGVDRARRWLDSPFGFGSGCDCWAF